MDRIDENKDAFVDMSELKNWISFTQRRYIEDDVNRQWKQHNPENAEKLHWEVSLLLICSFCFFFIKSSFMSNHTIHMTHFER